MRSEPVFDASALSDGFDRSCCDVKTFTAVGADADRVLSEDVTAWLQAHNAIEVDDIVVVQSQAREYVCISIGLFFRHLLVQ